MQFKCAGVAMLLGAAFLAGVQNHAFSAMKAETLRCEYRVDPLGIDSAAPRLSWTVTSAERGQKQMAYRVLVSDSPESLKANVGSLWDSGKIASDETACIVYAGKPLASLARCHWKVKVWDKNGVESPWSAPAEWTMGVLTPQEAVAQWIGMDNKPVNLYAGGTVETDILKDCKWIWLPDEGNPTQSVPAGIRYFRAAFMVDRTRKVSAAALYLAADNRATGFLNGQALNGSAGFNQPGNFDLLALLKPGRNVIALAVENLGSDSNPAGLLGKAVIKYADGTRLVVPVDASWKCFDKEVKDWQAEAFDDAGWKTAAVFAANGDKPWSEIKLSGLTLPAPVYLRQSFNVSKSVKRAVAVSSALGIYTLYLNGKAVGGDYFAPGWTDYVKRVYYNAYDVTSQLRRGENVIGGILADGWFAGYVGWGRQRDHYSRDTRLGVQLHIEYTDGTKQVVASDGTWKTTTGPTLDADFLMGETYDARRELTGWDKPGYDDSAWSKASVGSALYPMIEPYPGSPVQVFKEISPVKITEPVKGVYVFDMGTNLAGVVRLKVKGKPGDTVVLRFAERLNPDGTIYTTNLRGARATDTYVCKGIGTEVWQPHFTFHGFQYVEVTGYPGRPGKDAVTAVELTSSAPVAGAFSCSDPMLNQLYHNICQTQRSNFIDIPTDCPQRDERLGWTGDAQVYVNTACYNNDVQAFFTKWLVDLEDAQGEDGQFPKVAPVKVGGPDGGPAWADAGVICPWTIYKMYGDSTLLEKHYDAMKKFIAFCKNRSTSDLLPPRQFHCFGDWLNIDDNTPNDVIYTAYFAYSTYLTARSAEALGKTMEVAEYDALFEGIKAAFNKAYIAEDGRIKGDSQTAYVLALAYDLVDGQRRNQAAEHLIRKIRDKNWHLSTGFIGTKDLMLVLSKIGRNDVAYRLLHNETFPSWGFSIKHGATSIWERWNGWTPEQGFGDPGMNSFAHYSFGAVGQWMFENIGGINTDGPGFKNIILRPHPGGKLTWANVRYDSVRGSIVSNWKLTGGVFELEVQIPANTAATLYLPTSDPKSVRESGKPISESEGVKQSDVQHGTIVLALGSGKYKFRTDLK